ncbi:MAG: hypothetical protein F4Y44_02530 [Chloroflexi bacterium]|nr:hypothetical protein [Chloroflexota bacterium]
MNGKKEFSQLPQVLHTGKYAVVYDIAHANGSLYYLSMVGPRQMSEGIAAALLDSGKNNKQDVYLQMPIEEEESSLRQTSMRIKIADNAVGTMKRTVRKVAGTRVWQTVLISQLVRWDYNYAHIQAKSEVSKDEERSEHERAQEEAALRRFVLLADADEDEERTASRWFAYLPRRVSEPMLAEWAVPLWDYCLSEGKGIEPMTRLRGRAWRCEPTRENLREAISELGAAGELWLPSSFPNRHKAPAYDSYAIAAD